jgi:hypothetical protein
MAEPRLGRVEQEILEYFVRHPEAADTLDGVARWRLLDEAIHRSVEETEAALLSLVAQGLLCETRHPGGAAIFSLDRRASSRARTLAGARKRRGPR